MQISFLGATDEVTGSMTLIETAEGKILIDSGLYQGEQPTVSKNFRSLPFDPKTISALILTHAHLDHSGHIPRLIKLGFRGKIFCTRPTAKLARIIMADSARLMEKSENPSLNHFYATEDVVVVTSLLKTKKYYEEFEVLGMKAHLFPAGHILGASSVHLNYNNKTIIFSGDLGRRNDPLIQIGDKCPPGDVVVMESTYGAKIRQGNLNDDLQNFVKKIKNENRVGLIASFAVARAQLLIVLLHQYFKEHPEDKVRFVIDGPMMTEANNVYKEFAHDTNLEVDLREALLNVENIDHANEWESISKKSGPLIVIASSGMVTGGKIWRYLENWQNDSNALLFLPGYQGEGTPGKSLSEGVRTIQDANGKNITWNGEILTSEAFSSHADQNELLSWLENVNKDSQILLNHGEASAKIALKNKLNENGFRNVSICGAIPFNVE